MKKEASIKCVYEDESGAIAIITALILFFILMGVAALAVDVGRLMTGKNELQNSADSGALAGAGVLLKIDSGNNELTYNDFGYVKNIAKSAAEENYCMNKDVEISISDIQVGHWSFGYGNSERGFYPYDGSENYIMPSNLITYISELNSEEENYVLLDEMDGEYDPYLGENRQFFINAVRVVARSEDNKGFFSNIFKQDDPTITVEAIGYIGPAGTWNETDFDYPIAICAESLEGNFCNVGRMLEDNVDGDTAQWTNFSQPCSTSNTPSIQGTLDTCGLGNLGSVTAGMSMGTTLGVVDAVFDHPNKASFVDCWKTENEDNLYACESVEYPTQPWPMTLPVIKCTDGQPNCRPVTGAVSVDVLWVLRDGNKPDRDAPCKMGDDWDVVDDNLSGEERWDAFVEIFELKSPSGEDAHFAKKSVYFAPNCIDTHLGGPGGKDFYGVLSKIPVLVK